MKAIPQSRARGPIDWSFDRSALNALHKNFVILLGLAGLCSLYFAPALLGLHFPNNMIVPSILTILGCMTVQGKRSLTITPVDYLFGAWFALIFASQIFANEFLCRNLGMSELTGHLWFLFTCALVYRAFFAMGSLDPVLVSKIYMILALLSGGGVIALGFIQRFGPGKSMALKIGETLSTNVKGVKLGFDIGRPTAMYENPNMLGYLCCIFAALVMAWTLSDVSKLKPWKTLAFSLLLGLSVLGAFACQSRQNAALLALTAVVIGLIVHRYSRDWRNSLLLGLVLVGSSFGIVSFLNASKSSYILSATHSGISKDDSFQDRVVEFQKLGRIAADIAPLGTAQSASNLTKGGEVGGYSYYRMPNIDSEWGNMYAAFGVWGPLLVAGFYFLAGRLSKDVWKLKSPEARMIGLSSLIILGFNLILTTTAVRVFKFETGLFTFEILGLIAAWRLDGIEKGMLPTLRKRLKGA